MRADVCVVSELPRLQSLRIQSDGRKRILPVQSQSGLRRVDKLWSVCVSAADAEIFHKSTLVLRETRPRPSTTGKPSSGAASMDTVMMLVYVAAFLLALALAVAAYSGLFHSIDVQTRAYPLPRLILAYKFCRGPFHNVDPVFDELSRLAPGEKWMGIYYDNPYQVGTQLGNVGVGRRE